jgi:phosphoglycolate phosphatase
VSSNEDFEAILFDLDGTLVDTAPDMVAALVDIQQDEGHKPIAYELARTHVSHGAAGLVKLAFPGIPFDEHERLGLEFLDRYEQAVCINSVLFSQMAELLDQLDGSGLPWGIVTNKPTRMTEPLLAALDIDHRAACVICGDTIPQRKPDPEPLLLASRQTGVEPNRTIYVGDAARDIEAGLAAGMFTIAATYGYITADDDPLAWNAHQIAASTEELTHQILKGVNLTA